MSGASFETSVPRSVLTVFPTILAMSALGRAEAEAFTTLFLELLYCGTSRIPTSFDGFVRFDGTRGR